MFARPPTGNSSAAKLWLTLDGCSFNLNPGEDSKLEYSMDGSLLLHTHLASASVLDAASAEQLLVIKGPADDMVQVSSFLLPHNLSLP